MPRLSLASTRRLQAKMLCALRAQDMVRVWSHHLQWPAAKTEQQMAELTKFYALKRRYKDFKPPHTLSPTPEVDELWHLHILQTQHYKAFCKRYLGQMLHHSLAASLDSQEAKQMRQTNTQKALKKIWPAPSPPSHVHVFGPEPSPDNHLLVKTLLGDPNLLALLIP